MEAPEPVAQARPEPDRATGGDERPRAEPHEPAADRPYVFETRHLIPPSRDAPESHGDAGDPAQPSLFPQDREDARPPASIVQTAFAQKWGRGDPQP